MTPQEISKLLKRCSYRQQYIKSINLDVSEEFTQFNSCEDIIEQAIDNPDWPLAVRPEMIVRTEDEKSTRAMNIISVFTETLKGKKVLDYGCGEGHLIAAATDAQFALGYDLVLPTTNGNFTSNRDDVTKNAPYDIIFLYDVLDHATDPIALLQHVSSVMHRDSVVYIRCQPWCARHGGRLFKNINKAYLHYFLTDPVCKLLSNNYPVQKVIHPLGTYGKWFADAGLKVVTEEPIQTTVEPFFYAFADTIKTHWQNSPLAEFAEGRVFPAFPMSIEFVDFTLTRLQA